jgi:hypothetical protein
VFTYVDDLEHWLQGLAAKLRHKAPAQHDGQRRLEKQEQA